MLKNLTSMVALVFVVAGFMYAGAAQAELITEGLVAYWSLDASTIDGKEVADVWGDNDGIIDGDVKEVAGKVGEAMEFDGISFINIPGTDALNFAGSEEMTIAAWISVGSDDPVIGVVAGCCGSIIAQRDVNSWALRYDGRNAGMEIEFIVQPGWTGDGGFGAEIFAVGEWHHMVGVVGDGELKLYLDGEFLMSTPYGGPMASDGSETEIGNASDGGFIGSIDEVLIYERILDEDEVREVFQAQGLAVEPGGKLATAWGAIKK